MLTADKEDTEMEEELMPETSSDIMVLDIDLATKGEATKSEASKSEASKSEEERERELTERFLAGSLSFSEYTMALDSADEDDDEANISKVNLSLDEDDAGRSGSKRGRKPRKMRALPAVLRGLVGEANLRFARGDTKTAERMCLEIIREAPYAPEPFLTLAQINEFDNPEKSYQYYLIAAYLNPSDTDLWLRVAETSLEHQDHKQALRCYSRAITACPSNLELHLKRIRLLERLEAKHAATSAYMRLLNALQPEHSELMYQVAVKLAQDWLAEQKLAKAFEALSVLFAKLPPSQIKPDTLVLMLDVAIRLKNYKHCLELLVQFCELDVELQTGDEQQKLEVISCRIPPGLNIDLKTKLLICLVYLEAKAPAQPLLEELLAQEDIAKVGDLFLDVADALVDVQNYSDALRFLVPLVQTDSFNLTAVWLRHAECLSRLNMLQQSVESYQKVLSLSPEHLEARFPLAENLAALGMDREAAAVLYQNDAAEAMDPGMLYMRCGILRRLEDWDEYIRCGVVLMTRHCYQFKHKEEVEMGIRRESKPNFKKVHFSGTVLPTEVATQVEFMESTTRQPTADEEYDLFHHLVATCHRLQRYDVMQRLTCMAMTSRLFAAHVADIELMLIYACIFNEDKFHAFKKVRDLILAGPANERLWNLYNAVLFRWEDNRHIKFLTRFQRRQKAKKRPPDFMRILTGNNHLTSGTYKYALAEYLVLMDHSKDDLRQNAIVGLLAGITFIQIATQKFMSNKDSLVTQGFAFLQRYTKARGEQGLQEVCYNMGRAYQQIGMNHMAVGWYERGLELPVEQRPPGQHNDLSREIAFNLHLVYCAAGAYDLARMYLRKYVVV